MSFKSVDEIFNFDFQDAIISDIEIIPEGITFTLDGLIVEPENSQNENFTKSYAASAKLRLSGGRIKSGFKDGYKFYDADNKLVQEVNDSSMSVSDVEAILKKSKNAYLFAADICDDSTDNLFSYNFSIEFPNKEEYDTSVTDSYQINITFTKAIVTWDKYLNKVQ